METIKQLTFVILVFLTLFSCGKDDSLSKQLLTYEAKDIKAKTATFGGSLINEAASGVTEIGVVIDTVSNPTISENVYIVKKTLDENNEFSFNLFGLSSETTYYYRTYATNAEGTYYGNELIFRSAYDNYLDDFVVLTDQAEVDEFGIHEYTGVQTIVIKGAVNDLSPLSSIVYIRGGISFSETTELENLNGLTCLERIGVSYPNSIYFNENEDLINFEGLNNLKYLNGHLMIISNPKLKNLNGFENIQQINSGEFSVSNCSELTDLSGLNNLRSIEFYLKINDCPSLVDLSALSNLSNVGESISMFGNSQLSNFCGLKSLLSEGTYSSFYIGNNLSNPSVEEIINDCP